MKRNLIPLLLAALHACSFQPMEKTYPPYADSPIPPIMDMESCIIYKSKDMIVHQKTLPCLLNIKTSGMMYHESTSFTYLFIMCDLRDTDLDPNAIENASIYLRRSHMIDRTKKERGGSILSRPLVAQYEGPLFDIHIHNVNRGLLLENPTGIFEVHGRKSEIPAQETDDELSMIQESSEGYPGLAYYASPVKVGSKSYSAYHHYLSGNNQARTASQQEMYYWDIIDVTEEVKKEASGDKIMLLMMRIHSPYSLMIYYYGFENYKLDHVTPPIEIDAIKDNYPFLLIQMNSKTAKKEVETRFCSYCGHEQELNKGDFCSKCGKRINE